MEMKKNEDMPMAEAISLQDGFFWYVPINGNYVCKSDIRSGKITVICRILEEPENGFRLFSKIVDFGLFFFLIPLNAKHLYKVYKEDGFYETIRIASIEDENREFKFSDGHRYEELLILVCTTFDGLVVYEDRTKNIRYIREWMPATGHGEKRNVFFRKSCISGGVLYAPFYHEKKLLEYRMTDNKVTVSDINTQSNGFCGCCVSEGIIWMLSSDGGIITEYNMKTGESRDIAEKAYTKCKYADIEKIGNWLYCIPLVAKDICLFNIHTASMKFVNSECDRWMAFFDAAGKTMIADVKKGICYRCDNEGIAEYCTVSYPRMFYADLAKKIIKENEYMFENDTFGLESFVLGISK